MRLRISTSLGAGARPLAIAPPPSGSINPTPWLTPLHAASRLGITVHQLLPLVESGKITLFRAPDRGLLFRLDELDAVPVPLKAEEAACLLVEVSPVSTENTDMTSSTSTNAPNNDMCTLKEAEVTFKIPYKILWRLAHEGAIPAVDLNAHRGRKRARFVVSVSALRQYLKSQGEIQAVVRRSKPQGINLVNLAQPRGGAK